MVQGLLVWANLEVYLESKVDPWVWRSGPEKDEELGWGCSGSSGANYSLKL